MSWSGAHVVRGYSQDVRTHTELAQVVASRKADVGLGLQAAAQANNLDFLALFEERYDLVIPQDQVESLGIQANPVAHLVAEFGSKAAGYRRVHPGAYGRDRRGLTHLLPTKKGAQ